MECEEVGMAGPAQNGTIIYSENIKNLSEFYFQLFTMRVVRETDEFISLDKDGFNIIIHTPPFEMPKSTFSPIKLFLSVSDMEYTRQEAVKLGGSVLKGEWANPIFKVSNIKDRDGNHIQLREFFKTILS